MRRMTVSLVAGTIYFAIVFVAAVVLGVLRVLLIAPTTGELPAVLLELPVIHVWSWLVRGWIVRRRAVPTGIPARLLMGATGFAVPMILELGFSVFAEGRSVRTWFHQFQQLPALLGLLGQIAFGFVPLLR
jgi:hypothetical protein